LRAIGQLAVADPSEAVEGNTGLAFDARFTHYDSAPRDPHVSVCRPLSPRVDTRMLLGSRIAASMTSHQGEVSGSAEDAGYAVYLSGLLSAMAVPVGAGGRGLPLPRSAGCWMEGSVCERMGLFHAPAAR
jgi:hypothetical protein